jgi:hypothetical protein
MGDAIDAGRPTAADGRVEGSPLSLVLRRLADDDGAGEEQGIVFAGGNVDAGGVAEGEPAFGDLGDGVVAAGAGAGEDVFVVEKVVGDLEVDVDARGGGLVDGEAVLI